MFFLIKFDKLSDRQDKATVKLLSSYYGFRRVDPPVIIAGEGYSLKLSRSFNYDGQNNLDQMWLLMADRWKRAQLSSRAVIVKQYIRK